MTKVVLLLFLATATALGQVGQCTTCKTDQQIQADAAAAQAQADRLETLGEIQRQNQQNQTAPRTNGQANKVAGATVVNVLHNRLTISRINRYCKEHPTDTKMFYYGLFQLVPYATVNCAEWNQVKH